MAAAGAAPEPTSPRGRVGGPARPRRPSRTARRPAPARRTRSRTAAAARRTSSGRRPRRPRCRRTRIPGRPGRRRGSPGRPTGRGRARVALKTVPALRRMCFTAASTMSPRLIGRSEMMPGLWLVTSRTRSGPRRHRRPGSAPRRSGGGLRAARGGQPVERGIHGVGCGDRHTGRRRRRETSGREVCGGSAAHVLGGSAGGRPEPAHGAPGRASLTSTPDNPCLCPPSPRRCPSGEGIKRGRRP